MEFALMGYQSGCQPKLFYHHINLEQRVPQNHILRKIKKKINFDFIYTEVKDSYGDNGNVSIPPPIILKMMLLLILYNVRSEREVILHPQSGWPQEAPQGGRKHRAIQASMNYVENAMFPLPVREGIKGRGSLRKIAKDDVRPVSRRIVLQERHNIKDSNHRRYVEDQNLACSADPRGPSDIN
jgi:hypothetical protein